jgi:sulfite exporter TauE/SafE
MAELWLAFVGGFVSSMHCVGMCGPIVIGCVSSQPIEISLTSVSATSISTKIHSLQFMPHLLYHSGRLISYSIIGAIAGFIGSTAIFSISLQAGFGIAFGMIMIATALFQMNIYPKIINTPNKISFIQKIFSQIRSSTAFEAKFLIGFLTPLLPCGLLYGMTAHAAASLSPVTGAFEMGAFAFGAVPALALTGMLSGAIGVRIRKFGSNFAAILLIIMGLLTVARGAGIYHGSFIHEVEHVCGKGL